jgi:hypothetical protein
LDANVVTPIQALQSGQSLTFDFSGLLTQNSGIAASVDFQVFIGASSLAWESTILSDGSGTISIPTSGTLRAYRITGSGYVTNNGDGTGTLSGSLTVLMDTAVAANIFTTISTGLKAFNTTLNVLTDTLSLTANLLSTDGSTSFFNSNRQASVTILLP